MGRATTALTHRLASLSGAGAVGNAAEELHGRRRTMALLEARLRQVAPPADPPSKMPTRRRGRPAA